MLFDAWEIRCLEFDASIGSMASKALMPPNLVYDTTTLPLFSSYHKLVNKLPGTTQWLPQRLLRPPTSSVASSSSRGNNGFLCLFLRVESFTLTLIMSEGSLLTFQKQITMASYLSIFIHHVIVHEEAWMHFASYLETFLF